MSRRCHPVPVILGGLFSGSMHFACDCVCLRTHIISADAIKAGIWPTSEALISSKVCKLKLADPAKAQFHFHHSLHDCGAM